MVQQREAERTASRRDLAIHGAHIGPGPRVQPEPHHNSRSSDWQVMEPRQARHSTGEISGAIRNEPILQRLYPQDWR